MRAKSSLAAAGSAAVSSTRETSKDRGRGSSDSSLSFHMAFKKCQYFVWHHGKSKANRARRLMYFRVPSSLPSTGKE